MAILLLVDVNLKKSDCLLKTQDFANGYDDV